MAFKRATLKRTSIVRGAKKALGWVKNYIDETAKHKGKDVSELGIGIGKNYFTSRPVGMISAHGYAAERVAAIHRTTSLPNNEAVLAYLDEYCADQRAKKRRKIGVRMVLSFDPEKISELCERRVDIDQLLVSVAEETFGNVAATYYPDDDLGFIMAMHHDAETFKHATSRRFFILKHGREPRASDRKPHIHAHIMVLARTRKEKRINFSDRSDRGDGIRLERLTHLREEYQDRVSKRIYHLGMDDQKNRIDRTWDPIIREAAATTLEDFFFREKPITDKRELRRRVLERFTQHVRTLDRTKLAQHFKQRQGDLIKYRKLASENPAKIHAELQKDFAGMEKVFRANCDLRVQLLDEVMAKIDEKRVHPTRCWDTPSNAFRVLSSDVDLEDDDQKDAEELRRTLFDLEQVRRVSRMQSLAELTRISLKLQAARKDPNDPDWLDLMGKLLRSGNLPNKDILIPAATMAPPAPSTLTEPVVSGATLSTPRQTPPRPGDVDPPATLPDVSNGR